MERHGRFEFLLALLIGATAVASAGLTWRAARLDADATAADRRAGRGVVATQQFDAAVRTELDAWDGARLDLAVDAARHREAERRRQVLADAGLDPLVDRVAIVDPPSETEIEAVVGARPALDGASPTIANEDAARERIEQTLRARADGPPVIDVAAAAARADGLRERSGRLSAATVGLLAGLALLTFAEVSRDARRRSIAAVGGSITVVVVLAWAVVTGW